MKRLIATVVTIVVLALMMGIAQAVENVGASMMENGMMSGGMMAVCIEKAWLDTQVFGPSDSVAAVRQHLIGSSQWDTHAFTVCWKNFC